MIFTNPIRPHSIILQSYLARIALFTEYPVLEFAIISQTEWTCQIDLNLGFGDSYQSRACIRRRHHRISLRNTSLVFQTRNRQTGEYSTSVYTKFDAWIGFFRGLDQLRRKINPVD